MAVANPPFACTAAWVLGQAVSRYSPTAARNSAWEPLLQHQAGAAVLALSRMRPENWVKLRRGHHQEAAGLGHAARQPGTRICAPSFEKARRLVQGGGTPGTSEPPSQWYSAVTDVCWEPSCGGSEDKRSD